jgi:hypothetical protein
VSWRSSVASEQFVGQVRSGGVADFHARFGDFGADPDQQVTFPGAGVPDQAD